MKPSIVCATYRSVHTTPPGVGTVWTRKQVAGHDESSKMLDRVFRFDSSHRRPRSRHSRNGYSPPALVCLERLEERVCLSAVGFFALADGFTAVDQGYDSMTETTYIVGQQLQAENSETAMLARSQDLLSFQMDELVGLGPDTQVFGISADGSMVAGISKSPASVGAGEGTVWFSS